MMMMKYEWNDVRKIGDCKLANIWKTTKLVKEVCSFSGLIFCFNYMYASYFPITSCGSSLSFLLALLNSHPISISFPVILIIPLYILFVHRINYKFCI